jgi:diguanylate cyclase (GGDEF)-like protein
MFKSSFLLTYITLTMAILIVVTASTFISYPYSLAIQIFSIITIMTVFIMRMRYGFKSSLKIFQNTIKKVALNDPSLDDEDMLQIKSISDSTFINPKMLVKYANTLLINQSTILEAVSNDRDFINRNKKLQDTIIKLNHSIVTTEKTETLLDEILRTAIDTIEDGHAGSVLIPRSDGSIKYVSAIGMKLEELRKIKINIKDTFVYRLNKENEFKPIIVRDKIKFNKDFHPDQSYKYFETSGSNEYPCSLSAPIVLEDTIYGLLCVDSRSTSAFNKDDLRMMEYFTSEMAIVIKNSRLINKAIQLSKFDSLTNVHNRHFFEEIARIAFEEVSRYKGQLHIVLFDLDDFKTVNDMNGHQSGDDVLKKFSDTFSKSIRGSDIFARFGGDEFIALFRNSSTENVEKRISGIKRELEKSPMTFNSSEYKIKFSYGIAGYPEDGTSLEELLRTSDANMYSNKENNKKEGQE